jgi:hypothetical protein
MDATAVLYTSKWLVLGHAGVCFTAVTDTSQRSSPCAAAKAGLPPEFIPRSPRHLNASVGHGHLCPSSFDRARAALDAA